MEQITNDQLIRIIQGGPGAIGGNETDLEKAAKRLLLKRLSPETSEKIDSIFDVEAIKKESEAVQDILRAVDGKVPKWSEQDMLHFAKLCFFADPLTWPAIFETFKKQHGESH